MYSYDEVLTYVEQEDVKFIRLAFCDIFGAQKNISIMPCELHRAFTNGISFDASAINGLGNEHGSSLLLIPDPSTLTVLPWRPTHGRVVRLYCDIKYQDGTPFDMDSRYILKNAIKEASNAGIKMNFATEYEFYLFKTDEDGEPTEETHDKAGYMDIAPEDKGENVRREICLSLEEMDIHPEYSHHEEGPGQHEIDFKRSDPLSAADDATTFKSAVRTIAGRNGLFASFMPKPLKDNVGNAMHINILAKSVDDKDLTMSFTAGIIKHIKEITAFLNPTEESYIRLGVDRAPNIVSWSKQNLSQLIRICNDNEDMTKIELRSPDPCANPYIAFSLLIYAGLDGVKNDLEAPEALDVNLFKPNSQDCNKLEKLPATLAEAIKITESSEFIKGILPDRIINAYRS